MVSPRRGARRVDPRRVLGVARGLPAARVEPVGIHTVGLFSGAARHPIGDALTLADTEPG